MVRRRRPPRRELDLEREQHRARAEPFRNLLTDERAVARAPRISVDRTELRLARLAERAGVSCGRARTAVGFALEPARGHDDAAPRRLHVRGWVPDARNDP